MARYMFINLRFKWKNEHLGINALSIPWRQTRWWFNLQIALCPGFFIQDSEDTWESNDKNGANEKKFQNWLPQKSITHFYKKQKEGMKYWTILIWVIQANDSNKQSFSKNK